MHPSKVRRDQIRKLTDLPNVGPACAADLQLLGIDQPEQLAGRDAYELYFQLCELTHCRQDPCVADVLLAIIDFVDGAEAKPWWHYTSQRKAHFQQSQKS
ncbi:helix-hairpin-helix domain-containing protein [Halioxenophilus sp. WMMB6]|uniref:helix-hairpin-helix domain-containing protein n=1 Tax=Halioxenophilus sp. WMMB6 TaxID=3073815 RepID=UPI00295EB407|nr:helix-hairpin-helix domain-containing protein [Halioxenophilus sp. WMMB6]